MENIKAIKIYNKWVYPVKDQETFLSFIKDQKKLIIAGNAKKVVKEDPAYVKILNENIVYPDGKAIVDFFSKKGHFSIKYPGYLLWHDFIKAYHQEKTFYLVGAANEVITETVNKLRIEFPDIKIKGFRNGYFKGEEKQEFIEELKNTKPDVVLVALSYPMQEFFMTDLFNAYPALYIGLGGSFNVYTNKVKPVPIWWEKYIGYESIFRLLQDPTKIKRQAENFKFLVYKYLRKL